MTESTGREMVGSPVKIHSAVIDIADMFGAKLLPLGQNHLREMFIIFFQEISGLSLSWDSCIDDHGEEKAK